MLKRIRVLMSFFIICSVLIVLFGCSTSNQYKFEIGSNYKFSEKKLETTYDTLPLNKDVIVLIKSSKPVDALTFLLTILSGPESKVLSSGTFISCDESNWYSMASFKVNLPGTYYIKVEKDQKVIFEKIIQAK